VSVIALQALQRNKCIARGARKRLQCLAVGSGRGQHDSQIINRPRTYGTTISGRNDRFNCGVYAFFMP
jgi:hypothetical protein